MIDAILPLSLIFSRIAIGLVFAASSIGKIRSFPAFGQAIENFQILPRQFVRTSAYLFLGGEIVVVVLMVLGGKMLLMTGFILAILLLSVFCIALFTVLVRKLQVSCNCFGSSEKPASRADIWRNVGFIICALVGTASLITIPDATVRVSPGETGLLGMMAIVFVAFSVYLGEIVKVFRIS